MKMSTSIRQLLLVVMCLFGLNASAQFSATLKQGSTNDWSNVGAQFKLTDVAEALGTDTATLVAQLSDIKNSKVFAVMDSTGTVTDYTGNPGEFWLSTTGQVCKYPNGAWFVGQNFDEENNIFNVYAGQYPNYFKASDTLQVKAALILGDKTATFDITYQVYVPTAPEAELAISKLQLVGESSVAIEQYPRSGFDTDKVYVKLTDIADKLGCGKEDFSYLINKIAYMPRLDATYGTMSDSLTLYTTNDGWTKRALSAQGDALWACGNTGYAADDNLYLQQLAYNQDNDTLSCTIGQYPNSLKVGDKPYIDIYFVYGSKAYKVTYTVNIIEAPFNSIEDMTKVGETTITLKQEARTDYTADPITIDMETIKAALGVEANSISMQAMDSNGSLSSTSTANNGGYWLTQTGVITGYGPTAYWFVEPATKGDYGTLNVGQYPKNAHVGDTARVALYFVAGEKYYLVNVELAIVPMEVNQNYVSKLNRTLNIQALPGKYEWSTYECSISLDDINAAIGTTSPTLYALISDTLRKANPDSYPETMIYTKQYNMTPAPGFWVDKDGKSRGWVSDEQSPWGMYIKTEDNKVKFYAMQFDADPAGTAYSGQFFLVNESNNEMVTVTLNYQVVSKIENITVVGTTDIMLPVGDIDQEVDFDFAPVAEALGTDVNTMFANYPLVGMTANGVYCDGVDPVNAGLMFDKTGACDNDGGAFGINFSEDGKQIITFANNLDELGENFSIPATIGFKVTDDSEQAKIYVINITFMTPDAYTTGVNSIKVNAKNDGKIYDLSGRQISKPAHGLYIMNGKKYMVK